MKVRSLGLALAGVAMLAAAAVLGAILVHDGEADPIRLAAAHEGDAVAVKGEPQPFFPERLGPWAPVRPLLGNHTYILAAEDGVVALLTSAQPAPAGVVLAAGQVALVTPHPDDPRALLVVIQVEDWRVPILFD